MAEQTPKYPLAHPYGGKGPLILGITWTEASVAFVLILMRTYTNAFVVKTFKWDYFWAMLTLVIGMITQALLTVSVSCGLGNHIFLLEPPQVVQSLKMVFIAQCLIIQSIGFGKYAVIAFIIRIQDRTQSRKKTFITYSLHFIAVSNFVLNIAEAGLVLTSCSPIAKFWNPALPGSCNHIERTKQVGYFQASWAAISDVLLAIIPVFVFWTLRISNKMKTFLSFLMAGGLLAAVAAVIKTVYTKSITVENDVTYGTSTLVIWAWTENWLILVLGSLPPLRALVVQKPQRLSTQTLPYRNRGHGVHRQNEPKDILMHPPASKRTPKDTDSKENILPSGAGIVRTTEVKTMSDSKDSRDDSNDDLNAVENGTAF